MKRYTLVLNFGYTSSTSLSYVPFTSQQRFKSAKEAVVDLANFLKEQFLSPHIKKFKPCCVNSKNADAEALFCSKCGTSLHQETFSQLFGLFRDWLQEFDACDVDSSGMLLDENIDDHRWDVGNLRGEPNQRFVFHAEDVLLAALGFPPRKDITFETICQRRSKNKEEDFSYWG